MADPTADNVHAIIELERQARQTATVGERWGDRLSHTFGCMRFVVLHLVALVAWIGWNELAAPDLRFDPFPYGLLTFVVSLEGVFIAIFVLMAQNRLSRQTDERDHLNLQVDLLAEQEMTLVLKMLRRISKRLDIPPDDADEARAEQLAEQTNVYELVQTLREELPESRNNVG
jgi:uncharacterized membrane protein